MPRLLNRLGNARQVAAIKGNGHHADGGGLYLRVQGSARSWVTISNKGGTRREVRLGAFDDFTLAEARERARQGDRPAVLDKTAPAFGDFADTLISDLESGWKNEKHRQQWRNTLATYGKPISKMRVDAITTDDVLGILRPIWNKKPETAVRVRGRIERVLSAAKAAGHIASPWENPAAWHGHLDHLLPKRKKLSRGHHAALAYADMPAFMTSLRARPAVAARALEFLILCASRTGEVIGAQWGEIDMKAGLWTIPAERMKASIEHTVLLGPRALTILDEMIPGKPGAFVFRGQEEGRPMSNMAMDMLLRRMSLDVTVHGFRSAFKDWAMNETEFPDDLSEEALAHIVGSKVRRAYRRSVALERRRKLMEAWEAFVGGELAPGERVERVAA